MIEASVNITQLIDGRKLGGFQRMAIWLCAVIIFIEGFDTQAPGYIAPALRAGLQMSPADLGWFFAAGLFGILLGAIFIAPIADRIGRRPLLLACVPFMGVCSILNAFSTSIEMLDFARFLTGLGIGGAIPNAVALTSEYSPHNKRALNVALIFTGFVVGATVVGLGARWLIPLGGWGSIFLLGGIMPLLITPVLFFMLPESVRFLILRRPADPEARRLLRRVAPDLDIGPGTQLLLGEVPSASTSVAALFRDGRAKRTLLVWIIYFMSLLDLFLLANWLPTEMQALGASPGVAITVGVLFQFGGVFGLGFGWFADRKGVSLAIGIAYLVGAVGIAGIGLAGSNLTLVILAVFGTGVGLIGGQSVVNATAAIIYPTEIRSTGVGWAVGIGRIGSIVGPSIAAYMHTMNVAIEYIFLAAALPALCAAVAATGLGSMRTAIIAREAAA